MNLWLIEHSLSKLKKPLAMKTKKSVNGPLSNAVLSKSHQAVLSKPFVFKILLLLVCLLGFLNTYAKASFTSGLFIVSAEEYRLSNSLIFEKEVSSSIECAQLCLTECLRCRSINFEKEQKQTKKQRRYKCQLNNATKTFKPEELVPDTAFNYLEPMQPFYCGCFTESSIEEPKKTSSVLPYKTIGCFKDTVVHAIATLEGKDPILDLDGTWWLRQNSIEKCYQAAKKRGFQVFGLQVGWCSSSATAVMTFDKYGVSTDCQPDGRGHTRTNQVYYIKDYVSVGCFKDTSDRAISSLEGKDVTLDGRYKSRVNAIPKCAVAARKRGYTMFAVQYGGQCYASASAPMTFNKYGKSDACQSDGAGGVWANEVYCIKG